MASLSEKTYNIIKTKIINCEYSPGEFLNETILSEAVGVSRTPIREALKRLTSEGLIKTLPQKGTMITEITINDLTDLYEVRLLLEPRIIRKYGHMINVDKLMIIRKNLMKIEKKIASVEEKYQVDTDLHALITDVEVNRYFSDTLDNVYNQNHRVRIITGKRNRQRLVQTNKEHLEIIELLLLGDYEKAADSMVSHLEASKETAIKAMLR